MAVKRKHPKHPNLIDVTKTGDSETAEIIIIKNP